MGAGGDGDVLGGTGIPIIGTKPGILVIYATKTKDILMHAKVFRYLVLFSVILPLLWF